MQETDAEKIDIPTRIWTVVGDAIVLLAIFGLVLVML